MSEMLQKGWLTTRDGQKYAPATLVENVYTRSGKPYDQRVREYIQNLKNTSDTATATLEATVKSNSEKITKLQDNTAYFNGEASDKLFIVDSKDNVIAYIDETGVNSIDFTIPNSVSLSGVKQSITTINNSIAALQADIDAYENIDASDSDQLFIIDSQENVIAYINHEGVHSINFLVDDKGSMDYLTAIEKLTTCIADLDIAEQNIKELEDAIEGIKLDINIVEDKTTNLHSNENNESLFIIDKDNNVVAYINDTGIHSIDFFVDEQNNKTVYAVKETLANLIQADIDINALIAKVDSRVAIEEGVRADEISRVEERTTNLETKTVNLDSSEYTNSLFIVDKDENVVAYIDATGLHAIDVFVDDKGDNGNIAVADLRNIKNRVVSSEAAISAIETKLANVSNVMDFIGAFEKLSDLYAYETPNNGDVAVVTDLATEYVYDDNKKTWIELGNSTATSTAISNLQSVVGRSDSLSGGETSHHAQLVDHDSRLQVQEAHTASFIAYQSEINTWKANLENNLNFEFDDRLYIVDKANNVIGYFDSDGLTVTNINIKTPVVPSGSTANVLGQSAATMMFFETTGTVTIPDSFL